jgi:putative FmdB family regulatory protein
MPMYEYVCQKCQHPFEALVFGEDEEVACPECKSVKVEKQLSVPAGVVHEGTTPLPTPCRSSGPPCGRQCSRWEE